MEVESGNARRVRFGAFEADLQAGELRKSGIKVRLQDQPFRVLALLLSRSGEVVSREQLRQEIWPDDTFVDFDHSLNTAINKIREALGDSASHPRFVETIPRRGYRFVFPVQQPPAAPPNKRDYPRKRLALSHVVVATVVLLAGAAALIAWLYQPPPSPEYTLSRLTFDAGYTSQPVISPDGKLVAYVSDRSDPGNPDLWVQQIGGGPPIQLTDYKGHDDSPVFSPDSSQILFHSRRDPEGLYVIPALGGQPRFHTPGLITGLFSPDGRWIASRSFERGSYRIWIVPASGGTLIELAPQNLAGTDHRLGPVWLPDSRRLLFLAGPQEADWYVAPIDGGPAVKTGGVDYVNRAGLSDDNGIKPRCWLPYRDEVVFSAKHGNTVNLWTVPLSRKTGQVTGAPRRLTTGPGEHRFASVSADGRLVLAIGHYRNDLWRLPLDANRALVTGKLERLTNDPHLRSNFVMSKRGDRMVFRSDRAGNNDLWVRDMESGDETRLTDGAEDENYPAITADGSKVAYISEGARGTSGYVVSVRGGAPKKVCHDCTRMFGLSSNGRLLLYRQMIDTNELWLLDTSSHERVRFLHHPENPLWGARLSPDDRWVAFRSTGVFVAPVRGLSSLQVDDWIQVTERSPTIWPGRWSPDGNLLYYPSPDGRIRAQRLDPKTKHPVGTPIEIYRLPESQISPSSRITMEGMSVAENQIVFPLLEQQSDIWVMEPRARR